MRGRGTVRTQHAQGKGRSARWCREHMPTNRGSPSEEAVKQQLGAIQVIQQQRALKRVNIIADACFRECITDFVFSKHLRASEEACLQRCAEKYLMLSADVGTSFSDTLASP